MQLAKNLQANAGMSLSGPVSEEMSQTLLTNKKHGKIYQKHATNIVKPTCFCINRKKYWLKLLNIEEYNHLNNSQIFLPPQVLLHGPSTGRYEYQRFIEIKGSNYKETLISSHKKSTV